MTNLKFLSPGETLQPWYVEGVLSVYPSPVYFLAREKCSQHDLREIITSLGASNALFILTVLSLCPSTTRHCSGALGVVITNVHSVSTSANVQVFNTFTEDLKVPCLALSCEKLGYSFSGMAGKALILIFTEGIYESLTPFLPHLYWTVIQTLKPSEGSWALDSGSRQISFP